MTEPLVVQREVAAPPATVFAGGGASANPAPEATKKNARPAGRRRASNRTASAEGAGRAERAPAKNPIAEDRIQEAPARPAQYVAANSRAACRVAETRSSVEASA